jgi:hypothetical protein
MQTCASVLLVSVVLALAGSIHAAFVSVGSTLPHGLKTSYGSACQRRENSLFGRLSMETSAAEGTASDKKETLKTTSMLRTLMSTRSKVGQVS